MYQRQDRLQALSKSFLHLSPLCDGALVFLLCYVSLAVGRGRWTSGHREGRDWGWPNVQAVWMWCVCSFSPFIWLFLLILIAGPSQYPKPSMRLVSYRLTNPATRALLCQISRPTYHKNWIYTHPMCPNTLLRFDILERIIDHSISGFKVKNLVFPMFKRHKMMVNSAILIQIQIPHFGWNISHPMKNPHDPWLKFSAPNLFLLVHLPHSPIWCSIPFDTRPTPVWFLAPCGTAERSPGPHLFGGNHWTVDVAGNHHCHSAMLPA